MDLQLVCSHGTRACHQDRFSRCAVTRMFPHLASCSVHCKDPSLMPPVQTTCFSASDYCLLDLPVGFFFVKWLA